VFPGKASLKKSNQATRNLPIPPESDSQRTLARENKDAELTAKMILPGTMDTQANAQPGFNCGGFELARQKSWHGLSTDL